MTTAAATTTMTTEERNRFFPTLLRPLFFLRPSDLLRERRLFKTDNATRRMSLCVCVCVIPVVILVVVVAVLVIVVDSIVGSSSRSSHIHSGRVVFVLSEPAQQFH